MANDYDDAAKNLMLDALAAQCTRVSLHSGDPGTGSDNELSGGGYARGTVAWDAADGGVAALSDDVDISIEGGDTVSWVAFWNTAGSTRYAKKDVTDEAFGGDGIYRLLAGSTTLDLNGE